MDLINISENASFAERNMMKSPLTNGSQITVLRVGLIYGNS